MNAMDRAAAQIAALGEASRARKARIDADARIIVLRRAIHSLTVDYQDGTAGAVQLFTGLAEGRIARKARAAWLLRARVAQLDGYAASVRSCLRAARATHIPEPVEQQSISGEAA